MLTVPQEMMNVILPFVASFNETVWDYAQILLMGAILVPGKLTVSTTLTVMGLKDDLFCVGAVSTTTGTKKRVSS